jgi:predicted transposase YbfD/YdcC
MNVAEFFFELDDPRREGSCYHVLSDIVMIVLCGYLADCEGFEEVHDYAVDKEELLKEFLELPCGIPSHDTLNRIFRLLDPDQLEAILFQWGKNIVGLLTDKHLIMDGKQLRGTRTKGRKQAHVQIVSLWAEGERMCLAQGQIADKTNEIKAIPEVLKPLDISGSVVTIDAIGCQKSLCELIVKDKKAAYVIGLKANQDGLYEQVATHFERIGSNLPTHVSRDLGHGRAEKRTVSVSEDLKWLEATEAFTGLRSVVCVEATRWVNETFLYQLVNWGRCYSDGTLYSSSLEY